MFANRTDNSNNNNNNMNKKITMVDEDDCGGGKGVDNDSNYGNIPTSLTFPEMDETAFDVES